MELHALIRGIQSKSDLVAFIEALAEDLRSHPDDWENHTLDRYVEALASWLAASDGAYRTKDSSPQPLPHGRTPGNAVRSQDI